MIDLLKQFVDIFLHIDKHLEYFVSNYGTITYLILFAIIFMETGFVVTPFLPGDSLLFATGAIIVALPNSGLNIWLMGSLLFVAAVIGDTVNYGVGKYIGQKAFTTNIRFIKKEYLIKTQEFYDKHGAKMIIFARFVPIIRTFAPFVAGVGTMDYKKFIVYNIVGAFLWVSIFLTAGYFSVELSRYVFDDPNMVRKNFTLIIFGIIILSILPAIFEVIKQKMSKKN